ncbi:triple tyrosine motif-containing protein [Aestuariibaculum sediminum]|uniref:triple tyrosine motif-containing protein n=1 Tax=Aestuariibaculum sediminum TaxID=2770637 RepID=UPI001CB73E11|nr:triple tyrosine motif-containing protein [Aestuariibaculum sediminum]
MRLFVFAQEQPPIQVYTPKVYGADNQNWSISQSNEKFIYVANNKGLLEFNGANWKVYESPNKTIVRSVKVIRDVVYTGCYMEFGFWNRTDFGLLEYTSLSKKLQIEFLEDEEIWNIMDVDEFILFQSLKRIYVYNKNTEHINIIDSNSGVYKIFKVNDGVYFQKPKEGVFKITKGKPTLAFEDPIFYDNYLINIYNHLGELLFQTEDNGFFVWKEGRLVPWDISTNNLLLNDRIYCSTKLKDNTFILGSISNGIIHLSAEGDLLSKINQTDGLSNNTVLSVFEDIDNNLWLGLENGVNCINIKSPYRIYNDDSGEIGSVNTSIRYKNNLYIGTNQGLFYKPYNSNNKYKFIEGTQGAVWCLKNINDTLFCGHNSGTFIIEEGRAKLIVDVLGTWDIKTIPGNNNFLIQGNYSGLYILEKRNNTWVLRNKLDGFDISSRFFEFLTQTELFVSHEYKGVFKLKLNQLYNNVLSIIKDSSVTRDSKSGLIKYGDNILYAQSNGVFKYDVKANSFQKDTIYSRLYETNDYTSGKLQYTPETNKLWAFSKKGINYLGPNQLSNSLKLRTIDFPSIIRNDVSGYENIVYLTNKKYLVGITTGYVIIDLNRFENHKHKIFLNLISNSNLKKIDSKVIVDRFAYGEYSNNENSLSFHFNVPNYDKYALTEFQYKLEGIYDNWSEWSTGSEVFFENLPFGEYTFYVRSRIGDEISDNIEKYSFSIARPWYISNVALVLYVVFIALFSVLMHNIYKRYYKKQREKLLQKTQRELELKELENKEQLMRYNNEKLLQDIENKNRELSLSTMNLIKKNEFLNNLKKELKKVSGDKSLNNVIKIIDQNLNNSDDWQTFEEAFNNTDKDFIKKIKSLHPSLTNNDLRLCTYLRLNLSSKEIAPLLNITPRSVEVKRYRLRKKLDLPHEDSLTNYILEL